MNSIIKNTVLIAILLASGNALSEVNDVWVKVVQTPEFTNYLSGTYMKRVPGSTTNEVEFWVKEVQRKFDQSTLMEVNDFYIHKEVARCSDGNMRLISSTVYKNGKAHTVDVSGMSTAAYFEPIPNSVGDVDVKAVCSVPLAN